MNTKKKLLAALVCVGELLAYVFIAVLLPVGVLVDPGGSLSFPLGVLLLFAVFTGMVATWKAMTNEKGDLPPDKKIPTK